MTTASERAQVEAASETRAACAHCGLPVPEDRRGATDAPGDDEGRALFCCHGCETVYTLLREHALEGYYAVREKLEIAGAPPEPSGRRFAELDHPAWLEAHATELQGGAYAVEFYLEGVHCAACVWLLERLGRLLDGVLEARLHFGASKLRVVWDPERLELSEIARTLDRLGYRPHAIGTDHEAELRARAARRELVRIGIAAAVAANAMLLAVALYAGEASGIAPRYAQLLRVASGALGLVGLFGPGAVFFRGAWAALRTRTAHMDLPIALGLGTGALAGAVNVVRGRGEIYFDSLTVLVFLLLIGRWLQARQQRRSARRLRLLFSVVPGGARRIVGDRIEEVPIEALEVGDLVEVAAGARSPVDGRIEAGRSELDRAALTGESRPAACVPGDRIEAGVINLAAPLRVRVEALGAKTRMGRLMALVEACTRAKAPVVQLADRISGWFVLVVSLLAVVTALFWWPVDSGAAIEHAVALLIVSCPCALGLATPLALVVAIGRAARAGFLIKGGAALQALAREPATILFDKTGTLTEGRMAVVSWWGERCVAPLIAALERESEHPVGRALFRYAASLGEASGTLEVKGRRLLRGGGIEGEVGGKRIAVGAPAAIEAALGQLPESARREVAACARRASTPVVVACEGKVVAVLGLGDRVRADARRTVQALEQRGYTVGLVSGDHPEVARAVAGEVGIAAQRVRGAMSPEAKLEYVEAARKDGVLVMVGDGVNDAAALAAAHVGVAVRGGAEASLAAADVYVGRPGLSPLLELIEGARQTLRVVRRTLVASLGYNAVAIGLAMAGLIHPLLAALLMPASSLTVVSLVLGAGMFRSLER